MPEVGLSVESPPSADGTMLDRQSRTPNAEQGALMFLTRGARETDGAVTFELGTIEHHHVDSIAVLCIGGSLCGEGGDHEYDMARFGVVGVATDGHVLVLPDRVSYSSNLVSDQFTSCHAGRYDGAGGAGGWSCQTSLYAVNGNEYFTLHAEWMGMTAELRAPTM